MNKTAAHFKTVCTHKYWVGYYLFKCGFYYQGITHDLSKFSPTEFFESVKYYSGTDSPINRCKKEKGYSLAWFHHRGRNPHHHLYWVDNIDEGKTAIKMPFKYMIEAVCDYLGAGRAYLGDKFTYRAEYEWWEKNREKLTMHIETKAWIDLILYTCISSNGECLNKENIKKWKDKYENDLAYTQSVIISYNLEVEDFKKKNKK